MPKKITGLSFILFLTFSHAFSAPKFPFPQQYTYTNGIMPEGISYKHVQNIYDIWVNAYYEDQGDLARIKFDEPQNTVSEGIGYGMLIMVYMDNAGNNTRSKFNKLWNYWKRFPSSGSLMHWKVAGFSSVIESGSATDGDIDVALALLLAAKQWQDDTYLNGAKSMMSAIRQNDVSGNLLDGGDQWNDINPSYMSTVATQLFNEIESGSWSSIQSGCYSHLRSTQHSKTGMWPNWTQGGVKDAGLYGFDAARIPWRLGWAYAWFGHSEAKTCCTKIVDWFKQHTGNNPGKIGQIYNLDGSIAGSGSSDNIPTFLGPLVVAGMVDSKYREWVDAGYKRLRAFSGSDDNYYNESLELLTMLLLTGNMPDITRVEPKSSAKLTVTVSPPEAGTVTISPEKDSYDLNEEVTITASSSNSSRYTFVGWGEDASGSGESITVTLNADLLVEAVFKDEQAMDLVDDCEDGNARTFLKTPWFTFNDDGSGGASTVTPLTTAKEGFKMTEGGFDSEYAVRIEYELNKGGFSGNPFVGVGFAMSNSDGEAVDISAASGIRFYYKGNFGNDTTCALKVESKAVTEGGAFHAYFLPSSSDWTEVNINWDDLLQPKWVTDPKELDLTSVTKFQWQVQGQNGSRGELWIDDIHLVGYFIDRPIVIPVITGRDSRTPFAIRLHGNDPVIDFSTGKGGCVTCGLFDLRGRRVRNLVSGYMDAGAHSVRLNAGNDALPGSSYVLKLTTADGSHTRRLVIDR